MNLELYIPCTLSQAQSVFAFILSILGVGWFFFLSVVIRYNASKRIKTNDRSVPVLETILPFNFADIIFLLSIKRTTLTIVTCSLVIFGLLLTQLDSIIVVNTISYIESCKTTVVKTRAQITTENFQVAVASHAGTEAMLQKRSKSGVPSGTLVGQLPDDPRWKFDDKYDVDPYPWRSSCSIYASGSTNVHMNTSIMYYKMKEYQESDLTKSLPEVNEKFKFSNSPFGYNFTRRNFRSYIHFNRTGDEPLPTATGSLTLMIEEFRRGIPSHIGSGFILTDIGSGVIHRLWTLRVPEEIRMPYNNFNPQITIVSVPIDVKVYECEVVRVKEGGYGSVNILGDIEAGLTVVGDLIGRKYLTAQVKGTDDTIWEYTPEYWASYMEVRDTMTANTTDVLAQIIVPCISIHPIYVLLVCLYMILIIIGFLLWMRLYKNKFEIPTSVFDWVIHACKESNIPKGINQFNVVEVVKQSEFRDFAEDIRIFSKGF